MKSTHLRILSGLAGAAIVVALGAASLANAANSPTVTSISPSSGAIAGGTSVTITGTGFTGATAVDFGSTPATITATTSDTSITATSPATSTAGVDDVTVTTPEGTSAKSSADRFTYMAPVTTDAATGVGAADATLNGMTGPAAATGHSFWVSTSTFSTMSSTLPTNVYSTPDLGAIAANSAFSASLSSAAGLPAVAASTTYYYAAWADVGGVWTPGAVMSFTTSAVSTPSAPAVTSISPSSGAIAGGTSVTITGTGFTGATAVDFGSTPATITATTSDTSITATSPATSTAGVDDVTVTTPEGTSAKSSADRFTYMAPVIATTTPVISDISVNDIGTSTATITWTTDTDSTSQVSYGTSASYGSTSALDTTPTMSHSVHVTGLSEATLYHFDVSSGNISGTATSSDMVFDTASTASTTPLAVTGIDTLQGNATADGTFADGWQWVLHFVVPTVENVFSMKFADFFSSTSSSTIPAANDIEFYSPEAAVASTSASAILETGNGYGGDLMLTGDTSTSTPGRQIDVYVNVAVPSGTPTGTYSTTFGAMSTST